MINDDQWLMMVNDLGKFHHDLTVLPSPGIMAFIWKSSPKWGFIQVSE